MRPRKYFCATMLVAACDREQTADGEAGALVDDAVRELVGIDLNGVCLLYGRHLGSFPTMNFRFPKACAAATASARRGVRNLRDRTCRTGSPRSGALAARLDTLRDQPCCSRCDEEQSEPAEHE